MTTTPTRLNKFLALHTGMSRREADEAIEQGRVTIDEHPVRLGQSVGDQQIVRLDGQVVTRKTNYTYLLLNKPTGYVCSRRRQGESPTIYELLPTEYHVLKPVGRLDRDSSGLILLTDDGDFAHSMTHPSFHKTKVYHVQLDRPLEPLHQQMISDYGIQLEDGASKFLISRLEDSDATHPTYEITMSEGRNRQIRRTFAALNYTVTKLHRLQFGKYSLENTQLGTFRIVSR